MGAVLGEKRMFGLPRTDGEKRADGERRDVFLGVDRVPRVLEMIAAGTVQG